MRRAVLAAAAAFVVAACGQASPDLFVVQRSGQDPGANLHLVVSDGGTVKCNDRKPVAIEADLLLDARQLARDLQEPASLGVSLRPGRRSVLSYRARVEAGTVTFSDSSPTRPHVFDRLAAFTKHVAENVCGIRR
jgi:hypothetical protein